ncbi:CapA family protein [Paenibacillus thermotolerans]|uniref:CapA family protein n=1 Tax=Paenibacillus thermotolerans TaxID=3027807 RepID=UPI002368663D|nr:MULTISPECIES: CapA family protein [unclassified Paenibacillus]
MTIRTRKSAMTVLAVLALLSATLFLSGCFGGRYESGDSQDGEPAAQPAPVDGADQDASPPANEAPEPVIPPPAEATIVAVGDIMMHTPQLPGAYDAKTGTYNFDGFFREVSSIISQGDWSIANLETPIAGAERGFKGYPLFNAPDELAAAIRNAGFNIVTTANNHALDQGASGAVATLNTVHENGLLSVGTYDSEEASNQPLVIEKNGIVNAILSYTYGTNGIPVPEDKPYLISLIDKEIMKEQIERARADGADFVTVALHFGIEYQRQPNDTQRELAEHCIKAGADLVLGSHPHVVQPYERIVTAGYDGTERTGVVMYSMGNFISNQFGNYKEYGVIFKVRIKKTYLEDGGSETEIVQIDPIPTWVHKYRSGGKSLYRILPLEAVAAAKNDPLIPKRMFPQLEQKAAEMNAHLRSLTVQADTPASP